ncbi:bifunctional phosphoribosyl-AMP cyclohydrolase/phosphoribosyl-ATP diphosphatase [Legionella qingyii]|uniref:Histidine biosynthesis bifunctional protein HisIE n=1 Tax=Legionella qingyii TaxID=2184757 RepID=A0A317U2W9_9GAMM|nr:bifunctional phosphoribosyl-AMP cyclohydrolase/phosphoribosyl-ATP diphosphatase HisIE [Legionella qingyii]PWY55598.1 bifunctional phosphoribosyl-AMP cyclohydrolase/phosphoribosyl-ATP diphosphatase [Legionella qingyii]RUR21807.1 bifunctional phosphoribosyl-AMP cyclohydrolase/phosphoribosyl-ATP diphosphatase HisIE [Legionella qingyii]
MIHMEINSLDWKKMNGLLPAIIQNAENGNVLMLGYMNQEALIATLTTGQLNLYSRSRKRLWRKGETSGNSMSVQHISVDCDNDSLLIQVLPKGPACHLGYTSCFQLAHDTNLGFIHELIELINERADAKNENSYTAKLLDSGLSRCAQKVGEEAVETVIAAVNNDREELVNESADLIFHLLVLLKACELSFYDVLQCLRDRDRSIHT